MPLVLKDELKHITSSRRKFLLLRICDVDPESAKKMCQVKQSTYNTWLHDEVFVQAQRRISEFSAECKDEAIRLLRKLNQVTAVLLEEQIILKIREEIDTGEYRLIKTNLAKDVYTKLIGDLDTPVSLPADKQPTWEQRLAIIVNGQRQQPELQQGNIQPGNIIEGQLVEPLEDNNTGGNNELTETVSSQETEHQKSQLHKENQSQNGSIQNGDEETKTERILDVT